MTETVRDSPTLHTVTDEHSYRFALVLSWRPKWLAIVCTINFKTQRFAAVPPFLTRYNSRTLHVWKPNDSREPVVMSVYVARPDVGTLMFRLFGRPLHPELLVTHAHSRVVNALWTAEFTLCPAGHVVSFHHKKGTLCEVVSSSNTELPTGRLVISRVLKGNRNESVEHDGGILYHMSHQVEYLEPDIFLTLHEELLLDSSTSQLAHLFPAPSRIAPAPLSYIQTEVHSKSLLVHAFHTFPENGAIVKTQSLFEI